MLLLVLLLEQRVTAIDTHFTDADGQEFTMIDTAGMRKSGKVMKIRRNILLCVPCVLLTVQMWS